MPVEANVADHYTASTFEHRNIDGEIYAAQIHAVYQHMPMILADHVVVDDDPAVRWVTVECLREMAHLVADERFQPRRDIGSPRAPCGGRASGEIRANHQTGARADHCPIRSRHRQADQRWLGNAAAK